MIITVTGVYLHGKMTRSINTKSHYFPSTVSSISIELIPFYVSTCICMTDAIQWSFI
uniref:Uncharacterized protein n=2 Tax=Rhizophora mucronata TaxID=61149 RepID=A0A2P2KDR8_RHIMU